MPVNFTDQQLQAYLDEALPAAGMSAIEQQLREDPQLRQRLIDQAGQREAGVHGLGEIWRRHRLSCPTRGQLGGFLLGTLEEDLTSYVLFHLEQIGCRQCSANLEDLRQQQSELASMAQSRRRRYFQTSAGYLKRDGK